MEVSVTVEVGDVAGQLLSNFITQPHSFTLY